MFHACFLVIVLIGSKGSLDCPKKPSHPCLFGHLRLSFATYWIKACLRVHTHVNPPRAWRASKTRQGENGELVFIAKLCTSTAVTRAAAASLHSCWSWHVNTHWLLYLAQPHSAVTIPSIVHEGADGAGFFSKGKKKFPSHKWFIFARTFRRAFCHWHLINSGTLQLGLSRFQ